MIKKIKTWIEKTKEEDKTLTDKEKMMSLAKEVDGFAKYIEWTSWFCTVIAVLSIAIMLSSPDYGAEYFSSAKLGYVKVTFAEAMRPELQMVKTDNEVDLLVLALILGSLLWGIRLIRKTLKLMKEGRPFDAACSRNIFQLGTLVLVMGNVAQVILALQQKRRFEMYQLDNIFRPELVTQAEIDFSFNMVAIEVAVILYLLSFVFKYGEVLQRESDETL